MNLAQDILRKSSGYIHEMPEAAEKEKSRRPNKDSRYVDKHGQQAYRGDIAKEFGVSPSKVKCLFDKYPDYRDVYKHISIDERKNNGEKDVYFLPDGTSSTAKKVGEFYGIGKFIVQQAWRDHDKNPVKANAYLMERYFVD